MRMFTQELMYTSLLKQQKFNKMHAQGLIPKKTSKALKAVDVAEDTGLKYIFVTASPVLTNEVKRFYQSLKDSLINHLKASEYNKRMIKEEKAAKKSEEMAK